MNMGGRLPAVAGMPANGTFLELSAGQTDWPEKIVWFCYQRSPGDLFRFATKKSDFPMNSPLTQHIKRSLPIIHYFPFALVNYSVTPTLTYFRPRWNSAANQRAQHCAGKVWRQSVNEFRGDVIQWRTHTALRLTYLYGNYYFYRWGNFSVSWAFVLCFMASLCFKKV